MTITTTPTETVYTTTTTTSRIEDADATAIATGGITATDPAGDLRDANGRDKNGMTHDEVFDQLEDENRVVTSGRGSATPLHDSEDGSATTGYSAGVGSGSGSD